MLIIGPQFITPSDVLAKIIDEAKLALEESHYRADPVEERRARRILQGRATAHRYGRRVRPWEC